MHGEVPSAADWREATTWGLIDIRPGRAEGRWWTTPIGLPCSHKGGSGATEGGSAGTRLPLPWFSEMGLTAVVFRSSPESTSPR